MGPAFHQTGLGKQFYEHHVPKIAENLNTISQELIKANQLKERELDIRERELNTNQQTQPKG